MVRYPARFTPCIPERLWSHPLFKTITRYFRAILPGAKTQIIPLMQFFKHAGSLLAHALPRRSVTGCIPGQHGLV
ncbi:hypothetical protein EHW99_0440 [Erwinia amylovora]|uniref:Uncharacterized protein n=2 Tax=Erwinia amylovora TaxID=552 RepID=A0A830ZVX7_ERWAM|nr:hypothetical protein EaACW_3197 [Erwinia amylovora ACW56400]QJQ53147.1 hypothetical protein EHX00_0440 [Erwinia amylovora]CBA23155.1 hypothetical protein predicted by Glimmer/Critica [Erwinia amylovora CFBP1430]CCO80034.1 hypothetical protein BN432_3261 [Erwinia amylovora Ea356]CCO83839.1 hypothetical protein BN433_3287 [Erwinia amylovora Ea266]CCO87600.1 hypothetical protein BN434_3236 [Erwinia amylovora CFBP 2585]CCO91395.1 hypothetical protein BN435_3248 [Erwinia amylovora 01SFR-BO]CCO